MQKQEKQQVTTKYFKSTSYEWQPSKIHSLDCEDKCHRAAW